MAALALVCAASANAATPQELTIPMSDGAKLACSLTLPDGTPPAGGWPGVMLFHGLGGRHQDLEPLATQFLAPAGYASLAATRAGTARRKACSASTGRATCRTRRSSSPG